MARLIIAGLLLAFSSVFRDQETAKQEIPALFKIPLGEARRIAILFDCVDIVDIRGIQNEIFRSTSLLTPEHRLRVVRIHGEEKLYISENGRPRGIELDKFFDALVETDPARPVDPLPAVRKVFADQPQLIYFIADHAPFEAENLAKEMRKLNAANKTIIHTIALNNRGQEYEKILRDIARENGGVFRVITNQAFMTVPFGYAKRIVFLCDSSGSMMGKFDIVRVELRRAIESMRKEHSFNIVFMKEDRCLSLGEKMLAAGKENQRLAFELVDRTSPHGSSNPMPGLRAAFALNPDLIYLLTDGDFPDENKGVIEEIRKLNKDKKVQVNTIGFLDRGESYEKLLESIAKENGGMYKFVRDQDLVVDP